MKVIYTHCWKLDKTVCRKVKRMWCHPSLPNTFGIFLQVLFFPPLLVRIFFAFTELRFNIKFTQGMCRNNRHLFQRQGRGICYRVVRPAPSLAVRPPCRAETLGSAQRPSPQTAPGRRRRAGSDGSPGCRVYSEHPGAPQVDQGATNHED